MDPLTLGLLAGLGNSLSGASEGQQAATAQKENYTLAKRGIADNEATLADQLSRQSQLNPLRDQALYNLQAAQSGMGARTAFNPTSFLSGSNSGLQGTGGVDLNALKNYAGQYTPGAGGVNNNVQQMILN